MGYDSKHILFTPFMPELSMTAHAEMLHAHLFWPECDYKTALVIASNGVCEKNFHEKMVNIKSLLITID